MWVPVVFKCIHRRADEINYTHRIRCKGKIAQRRSRTLKKMMKESLTEEQESKKISGQKPQKRVFSLRMKFQGLISRFHFQFFLDRHLGNIPQHVLHMMAFISVL